MKREFKDFTDFFEYYMSSHIHPVSLVLHFLGQSLFLISIIVAFINESWVVIPIAGVCAYLLAWTGHFVFEKNKPTTFGYPVWSFRASWRMYFYILTGKLELFKKKRTGHESK